jgi:hypothetical protein
VGNEETGNRWIATPSNIPLGSLPRLGGSLVWNGSSKSQSLSEPAEVRDSCLICLNEPIQFDVQ